MNVKKIFAAAVASVMAVSTMAIAASAAGVVKSSLQNSADDGNGNFQVALIKDGTNFYNVDVTKIASIEVTLSNNASGDEAWVGGAIITQCDAKSWNQIGQYSSASAEDDKGKQWNDVKIGDSTVLTFDTPDGFAADSTYVLVTIQSYSAEGIEVNVDNVVAKDASGAVLVDVANYKASDPAPDPDPTPDPNPDPDPSEDKKPATDTGIEGVAVVAGLAILATGAVVIAKKRK